MANANINITELQRVLDITPAHANILLCGNHGIGKSEVLTQYYTSKGIPVVPLYLAQMETGDLIGLPHKNEKTGRTEFMPPFWFPMDGRPIVLFLDEITRGRPEVLQAVMDLCLNRTLAGRKLPEGSRVIAACNDGAQYFGTTLDPALVSRFAIYNFRPTVAEYLLYLKKVDADSRIIEFLQEHNEWLDGDPDEREGADTGLQKSPDRRAWKMVSDVIKGAWELGADYTKAISGFVGPKAASAFLSSVSSKKILSGRNVLYDFEKCKAALDSYALHQLSVVNDGIFRHLEVEKVEAESIEMVKNNVEAYFDFLTKHKKEAAAHFANLYVQPTYQKAVSFLARNCQVLTMSMLIYVKGIKQ